MTKRSRKYFNISGKVSKSESFIGVIPTIQKYGKFTKPYDKKDFQIPSLDAITKIMENNKQKNEQ